MTAPALDFEALLRTLVDHHVDFVVVGGVCAVLQGAPLVTFDLDIVHSRQPTNIGRLTAALDVLDARYRDPAGRKIRPLAADLAGPGHHLLMTRFGPLDLFGVVGSGRSYEDLLLRSAETEAGGGLRLRLLTLEALIEVKEEVGDEKDRAALPLLRRTLAEKRRE